MPRLGRLVGIAAAGLSMLAARAEEPPETDLDFLEYLGSWEARDDEWEIAEVWEREEPPADGKLPPEPNEEAE